jgi:hypothetical protein
MNSNQNLKNDKPANLQRMKPTVLAQQFKRATIPSIV